MFMGFISLSFVMKIFEGIYYHLAVNKILIFKTQNLFLHQSSKIFMKKPGVLEKQSVCTFRVNNYDKHELKQNLLTVQKIIWVNP